MTSMLWLCAVTLTTLWVILFALNLGAWVHFLLVLAAIVIVVALLQQSRGDPNLPNY